MFAGGQFIRLNLPRSLRSGFEAKSRSSSRIRRATNSRLYYYRSIYILVYSHILSVKRISNDSIEMTVARQRNTRAIARSAGAPVPWLIMAAFVACTPIVEFMPRLEEYALKEWVPVVKLIPRLRETSLEARVLNIGNNLAEGSHARSASSLRRYYPMKIVNIWRRSQWALDQGVCAALLDKLKTGTRASSEA